MDGGDIGSESLQSPNWEVYKDAFAPPQPGRRVKPWERAPVPAHAPRLQGQKVWKKFNIKPQSQQHDKENHNAAQAELEKAGMGARKRPRMIGGRENISDAPWKKGILSDEEMGSGVLSPKKQRLSMAPGDADAFVVPKKRTNTNHLITPRKPLRKILLADQAQATVIPQIFMEDGFEVPQSNQEPTRDASMSLKPSPQKIPLNDLGHNEGGVAAPIVKPIPRRKSLRQSTRRLTRGTTPEQPTAPPAEELLTNNSSVFVAPVAEVTAEFAIAASESVAPVVEDPRKNTEPLRAGSESIDAQDSAISAETLEQIALEAIDQESVPLKATEEQLPGSQHDAELSVGGQFEPLNALEEDLEESPPGHRNELVTMQTSGEAIAELLKVEVGSAVAIEEQFTAGVNQTPKSQPPILNSIELGAETRFVSPTKSTGTPRSRRKTPQRCGSRRSTRSTRANSVPPEDIPTKQAAAHTASEAKISNPASSPVKPRVTKMPTMTASKCAEHGVGVNEAHMPVEIDKSLHTESTGMAPKPSVETETQNQEVESPQVESIMTAQLSEPTSHPEDVGVLEPVSEDNSSDAEAAGEDQNLAVITSLEDTSSVADTGVEDHNVAITAALEDKIFAEGRHLNIQDNVTFEPIAATGITQTEDEHLCSPSKPSQSKEFDQDDADLSLDEPRESSVEVLEILEPVSISITTENLLENSVEEPTVDLPETSTPNPSTTELVETISENAPANAFDHDDTDMLRSFLTRVKANKAAKAGTSIPKRKRSLPHSPIRLPLGTEETGLSPSSPKIKDEFDVSLSAEQATKRKRDKTNLGDDEAAEPKSIRRSGRTRLPLKAAPLAAPSFIPVRRLGQDADNTVTLRRNEEKELAALTRVNTRKNKGVALPPSQVLAKQAEEKEDPASRQRALKEVFEEKVEKQTKAKKRKTVVWAEELAQFQTEEGKVVVLEEGKEKAAPIEDKKNAVKVGVRSKMTLGMVVNGTPAPKRKMKGRS